MSANSSAAADADWPAQGAVRVDAEGPVLIGSRCNECGIRVFPIFEVCPACMSEAVAEERMSKSGTLYAFSTVHVGPPKWHKPFTVGYVDLDNGVRVFSHLRRTTRIGQRVVLNLAEVGRESDGTPRVTFVFEPSE